MSSTTPDTLSLETATPPLTTAESGSSELSPSVAPSPSVSAENPSIPSTSPATSPLSADITSEHKTQLSTPVFSSQSFQISPQDRSKVLLALRRRNQREATPFINLIHEHERSANTVELLRKKTITLQLENERLRQELRDVPLNAQGEQADHALRTEVSELEKRLYEAQCELTTALRGKDENSQKILSLNDRIRVKDDELNQKEQKVRNLQVELQSAQDTIVQMKSKIETLEEQSNAQADEYRVLALSCTQFEQRLLKSEDENRQILQQFMKFKEQFADQLNQQNDEFNAKRQEKHHQEIENKVKDLAKRTTESSMESTYFSNVILASEIPNKAKSVIDAHDDEVTCVRFLSNHNFITAGVDRYVKIWDSSSQGSPLSTLSSCNAAVTCVDVDHQESYLVAASYDYSSRIWSLRDHRLKHSLTGHTGKVMAARFISEDSYKVATGSYDRTIKVWDLKQRLCSRVLHCHSSCTDLVTIDSSVLCSGHLDKRIRFWDIRSQKSDLSTSELLLSGKVTSVDASRNHKDVLTCTKDGQLKVIDLRTMSVKATLVSDALRIGADYCRASLSPDGRYAMVGSSDGAVLIFDVNTQAIDRVLKAHQSVVLATAWSNDGTKLLSCDKSKKVVLWCDR